MKNKNNQRGFIRFIILLIVVLVVAQLLGYGPIEFFSKVIIPGIIIAWKLISLLVNFLVELLRNGYAAFIELSN
jgi:hypothetical protein